MVWNVLIMILYTLAHIGLYRDVGASVLLLSGKLTPQMRVWGKLTPQMRVWGKLTPQIEGLGETHTPN